jgi:hypothetical protein
VRRTSSLAICRASRRRNQWPTRSISSAVSMPSSHNAGIDYREPKLVKTADGLPQLFAVNTLGPYILTALITMPKRLVYLSSGMHYGAGSHLDDMLWERRRWNGSQAYAETKAASSIAARTSVGSPSERTSRPLP